MTLPAGLRPDCAACVALCCVMPPFDAQQGFGYDKPAQVPCRNLRSDCRCAIHDHLAESGFPGCLRYDCYGAGQRTVREFGGDRLPHHGRQALFAAFSRLQPLHELKALVHFTLERIEDAAQRRELHSRLEQIEALCLAAGSDAMLPAARQLRAQVLDRLRQLLPQPSSPC
ncbi:MAG: hypothetical protein QM696_08280 [Steroidobacteraceae bacterium]